MGIAQQRHFRHAFSRLIVHQTTSTISSPSLASTVVFSLRSPTPRRGWSVLPPSRLPAQSPSYRVTFVNLRRDFQHDADFFPSTVLKGLLLLEPTVEPVNTERPGPP